METWRKIWRDTIAPMMSAEGLEALAAALATDDPRLLQNATTYPPPNQWGVSRRLRDWPAEGACALGFCGWMGDGLETVAEVEEFFARCCCRIDEAVGVPGGCRWFLNWFDETPRDEMREDLLAEVVRSLAERGEP